MKRLLKLLMLAVFISFLQQTFSSVSAANDKSEEMPPLAPPIRSEHAVRQESVQAEPSPAPEGEMPPTAPPISSGSDLSRQKQSGSKFNLQVQRYQSNPDETRIRRTAEIKGSPDLPFSGTYSAEGNSETESAGPRTLTRVDIQKLAAHEIVLLIDRSASMQAMDCPNANVGKSAGMLGGILGLPLLSTSRWNWCLQQTSELSRQTASIYQQGFKVVLFSTGFLKFPNVTLGMLPDIFRSNSPWGGTDLARPLATVIGEYLQEREYAHGRVKPLMIGIITDGCPNNKQSVREAIIEATRLMHNEQEITIIFFLIGGMDFAGEHFVRDLSENLQRQGASFNIVKEVSFSELQTVGLAKAIAQKLR